MTDLRTTPVPHTDDVRRMVDRWYQALDEHIPVADVLPFLVDAGLEFHLPEGVKHGHAGFSEWYEAVTHRFFDEVHAVSSVRLRPDPGSPGATVDVVVNWQARIWDPPAAHSTWLGFDAFQTWRVIPSAGGPEGVRITRYVVDELRPMPGSPSL
ncbi:MAG: nuclear transport factor 2 family protein [Kineosporiaceae bacterium]